MSRTKIIWLSVTATILVIILAVGMFLGVYFSRTDIPLDELTRRILSMTFDKLELGAKSEPKRVIDGENPLNLVNYYGNEDISLAWEGVSDEIKPISVLLLIPGNVLKAGNHAAITQLESWANECEKLGIKYAIQNVNGETHMEERMPIAYIESKFAIHSQFIGLNGAELYNGINWRGDAESDQTSYIIDCIKLSAKYGGYFFWTDTNINYDNGMIVDYIENNEALYTTLKEYSKYVCMLNKESYGDPSSYGVMKGLWLAGLIGNWGIASDWWHWQVADKKSLFGEYDNLITSEWGRISNYPENMYVQSMMLGMANGASCFKAEAPNYSTSVGGASVAGYEYAIKPLFKSILNGSIVIPTREQVFNVTRAVIIGGKNWVSHNYNLEESNLYPNSGRAGIVALVPSNLRLAERDIFLSQGIELIDMAMSVREFDFKFGMVNYPTYLSNVEDSWYFINHLENKKGELGAKFRPMVNSTESVSIAAEEHTSLIINESSNSLSIYISNYRTDKKNLARALTESAIKSKGVFNILGEHLTLDADGNPLNADDTKKRKVTIVIQGKLNGGKPEVILKTQAGDASYRSYEYTEKWDATEGKLYIEILQNGVVELEVKTDDSGKSKPTIVRQPCIEDKVANDNDISALSALIEKAVFDKHNYNQFSYLVYERALNKAYMLISERTGSVSEIASAVKTLTKASDNLIDISQLAGMVRTAVGHKSSEFSSLSYSRMVLVADKALREMLSSKAYWVGRAEKLTYSSLFKSFNQTDVLVKMDKLKSITRKLKLAIIELDKIPAQQ